MTNIDKWIPKCRPNFQLICFGEAGLKSTCMWDERIEHGRKVGQGDKGGRHQLRRRLSDKHAIKNGYAKQSHLDLTQLIFLVDLWE